MKVGIMQPYFFPYIGYWQLMNAVDKYVVYDDVNYIKGGWINRNRILLNGEIKYINLPLLGSSSNKKINEIQINQEECLRRKILKKLEYAYKNAPYFKTIFPLIERIIYCDEECLSSFIVNSFKVINAYLEIDTEILLSSEIEKNCDLHGENKVINICEVLGATEYYNAVGGMQLYSFSRFEEKRIQLKFLQTSNIEYRQFDNEFYSNLSIVDVLMFNSKDEIKEMLKKYTLVEK